MNTQAQLKILHNVGIGFVVLWMFMTSLYMTFGLTVVVLILGLVFNYMFDMEVNKRG